MAYQIIGKIEKLGQTEYIPSKSGGDPFAKRELALSVVIYDRYTGKVVNENHPLFEFGGNNCSKLDAFNVGDMVTVDFVVQGRWYKAQDGSDRNFTKVVGIGCSAYGNKANVQTEQIAQNVEAAPVQQEKFPPQVDENGVPVKHDDLPF